MICFVIDTVVHLLIAGFVFLFGAVVGFGEGVKAGRGQKPEAAKP